MTRKLLSRIGTPKGIPPRLVNLYIFRGHRPNPPPSSRGSPYLVRPEILASNESVNTYSMLRIMPTGEQVRATLDPERLDNEDDSHVRS